MRSDLKIDDKRWAVRLSGEAIDLGEATELFGSGRQIVRDHILMEDKAVVLQADEFELFEEAGDVYDAAERILVSLNAILYLEDPARRPLAISSVYRRRGDDNWIVTIFPRSASIRLRGAKTRGRVGNLFLSSPPSPQSIWLQAGLNEEVVAEVLSHLRATPDWIALYKAYEAMSRDVGAVRSGKAPIPGWPSQTQIGAFTRDAQLQRHSKAWCETKGITSAGAMSFGEASTFICVMIRAWIEWRSAFITQTPQEEN